MTIEEFIEARIAEDEEIAKAADKTRWLPEDKGVSFEAYDTDSIYSGRVETDTRANMNHIARHDPATVLRQCAALRAALEWYMNDDAEVMRATIKAIAAIWADHPAYQQEWRVE